MSTPHAFDENSNIDRKKSAMYVLSLVNEAARQAANEKAKLQVSLAGLRAQEVEARRLTEDSPGWGGPDFEAQIKREEKRLKWWEAEVHQRNLARDYATSLFLEDANGEEDE
jgi:hypothetical protein